MKKETNPVDTEHEEQIKEQKDPKDAQIEDLIATLKRLQADFENYKKRVEKDREQMCADAYKGIITQLLPLIDTFDLAIKNKNNVEEYIKGTELIYAELMCILENVGVQPIATVGETFDPHQHQALVKVDSDKAPNTIIEELQKGYMLKNNILRFAKVTVAK